MLFQHVLFTTACFSHRFPPSRLQDLPEPRGRASRSKMTQGKKQRAPVQLCPGSAKPVPSPRQGVHGGQGQGPQPARMRPARFGKGASPGTTWAVAEVVAYAKAPYLMAEKPAAEPCRQRVPARGIIFPLKKKKKKRQENSIAKYIVPVTVTEMTLGLARLQSSC